MLSIALTLIEMDSDLKNASIHVAFLRIQLICGEIFGKEKIGWRLIVHVDSAIYCSAPECEAYSNEFRGLQI